LLGGSFTSSYFASPIAPKTGDGCEISMVLGVTKALGIMANFEMAFSRQIAYFFV
jgi:hypothetical protein